MDVCFLLQPHLSHIITTSCLLREIADQYGIVSLLGEYRTRAMFSKTWLLREAAQTKTLLMLQGMVMCCVICFGIVL